MNVELEHGLRDPATDVTGSDPVLTAKIAQASSGSGLRTSSHVRGSG
jgi:hypothetical protein